MNLSEELIALINEKKLSDSDKSRIDGLKKQIKDLGVKQGYIKHNHTLTRKALKNKHGVMAPSAKDREEWKKDLEKYKKDMADNIAKRKQLRDQIKQIMGESVVNEAEAGFDLTDISVDNFKKVLKAVGINNMISKEVSPANGDAKYFQWVGNGIEIRTTTDPIFGNNANYPSKPRRVGYAGSIGIKGSDHLVKLAFDSIKKLASNIKDEDPSRASFI